MLVPLLAAATLLSPQTTARSFGWGIAVMREHVVADSTYIRLVGVNPDDFIFRLDYLAGKVAHVDASTPLAVRADLEQQTKLELKLDAELMLNLCPVFSAIGGLDESFYNDDPKVPPDPVSFYVPRPDAGGRYSVVILLHGKGQTETDIISHEIFQRLADASHAILIAPWGTGSALWGDPAASETIAILDEIERTLPVDRKRVYLAGFALGAAGAFHLAERYPSRFSALLAMDGGLLPEDAFGAAHTLRDRNVYIVGGGKDPFVTPAVESATYRTLALACIPVSEYIQPQAGGDLYQTQEQIERAWNDMFAGVVRDTNTRECSPTI